MSNPRHISRRSLLQGAAAALPLFAAGTDFACASPAEEEKAEAAERKIKLGLVGNGKRGSWIANLFQQHGGYEFHAVADYFQEAADKCGDAHGVEKNRRFSGLSGYKKLIESGVEAVVIETPPYCIPAMAAAAVDAGLHVYMAKPAAIDVPGCTSLGTSSKSATQKKRVFMVDYQMPTDPNNLQVYQALREGKAGKLARMRTVGISGGHEDPPKTAALESRLQHQLWANDNALGGGMILTYDIHALDAAVWLTGQRPLAAMGCSRIARPNPTTDGCDVASILFEYADGLIHEHFSQHLPNHTEVEISCKIYSHNARAFVDYTQKSLFQIRGVKPLGGPVTDLYKSGAKRNIAAFYQAILRGDCENALTRRAIDGTLTAILGREAAARRSRLTMEELLRENRRIPLDLTGLKA
jgi:myo-inositol 2-dehydrogenase / D-chiro-inositol 1-dehydrogenase